MKLNAEQWEEIRYQWESDDSLSFEELSKKLPVTRQTISKRAHKHGWCKNSGKELKKITRKEIDNEHDMKNGVGRPAIKFKPEYSEQAKKLALLGLVDKEIAPVFGISLRTLNKWKIKYPEFMQSIKDGKLQADSEVALSLYKSAIGGHTISEEKVIPDGDGGTTIIEIKRQIPPDYRAQSLWLRNRQPAKWRDKVEIDAAIDVNETSIEFIMENFIKVMDKAHERSRLMRIERGLDPKD
ncbi:hypothetical protein AU255_04990 [Methyloprofundus sedimenti]|uniref:Terminase n=1 Tax=Methyloprofundus sedimenti TaxID=1420851 RepID=A0A1V8M6N3_9GAMM|nr:hypothetical protein [Methyloprofundus sedimenti]OQK17250.1 hypothetical protein AU255_04990 [Methyloprofundus sedimenti]